MTWYLVFLLLLSAPGEDSGWVQHDPSDLRFDDVTESSGIKQPVGDFCLDDPSALPAHWGSGITVFDFDNDDMLDVLVLGGEWPASRYNQKAQDKTRLYRNLGGFKFEDVTEKSGILLGSWPAAAVAEDFDGDGFRDLVIVGYGRDYYYRNIKGVTFVEEASRRGFFFAAEPTWSTSVVAFDYDRDGLLDLYITRLVDFDPDHVCYDAADKRVACEHSEFRPQFNWLYHNKGDGKFDAVTGGKDMRIDRRPSTSAAVADFNDDDWPDLYVTNYGAPNRLWLNNKDGTFRDRAFQMGVALDEHLIPGRDLWVRVVGQQDGPAIIVSFSRNLDDPGTNVHCMLTRNEEYKTHLSPKIDYSRIPKRFGDNPTTETMYAKKWLERDATKFPLVGIGDFDGDQDIDGIARDQNNRIVVRRNESPVYSGSLSKDCRVGDDSGGQYGLDLYRMDGQVIVCRSRLHPENPVFDVAGVHSNAVPDAKVVRTRPIIKRDDGFTAPGSDTPNCFVDLEGVEKSRHVLSQWLDECIDDAGRCKLQAVLAQLFPIESEESDRHARLAAYYAERGEFRPAHDPFPKTIEHPTAGSPQAIGRRIREASSVTAKRELLELLTARFPEDRAYRRWAGKLFEDEGKWEEARQHYEAMLADDQSDSMTRAAWARTLHRLGDTDRAVVEYRRAIRSRPGLTDAHLELAEIFIRKRVPEFAERHCKMAMQSEPLDERLFRVCAIALAAQGQIGEMTSSLDMLGQINPTADTSAKLVISKLLELEVPGLAIPLARRLVAENEFGDQSAIQRLIQIQTAYQSWLEQQLKINMTYNDAMAVLGKPIANDDSWTTVQWTGGLELVFEQPYLTSATLEVFDPESKDYRKQLLNLPGLDRPAAAPSGEHQSSDHAGTKKETGGQISP